MKKHIRDNFYKAVQAVSYHGLLLKHTLEGGESLPEGEVPRLLDYLEWLQKEIGTVHTQIVERYGDTSA